MLVCRHLMRTVAVALASALGAPFAQPGSNYLDLLARRLADLTSRDAAVDEVVASPTAMTPILLAWAETPPTGVRAADLNIGLAEAFDRMGTAAAVPFLIRVISVKRFPYTLAPWIKGETSVKIEYPAAEALIRIGPSAAAAVIKAAQGPMTPEERLLATFVVGQTDGVPGGGEFLTRTLAQANGERVWAENGLQRLKTKEGGGGGVK